MNAAASAGSSPLARGLHEMVESGDSQIGIIPARAGFTTRKSASPQDCKDHPRSRGVYAATPRIAARIVGSSPLARGLLTAVPHDAIIIRIIPARAGFTPPPGCASRHVEDHPRSRGVYPARSWCAPTNLGSSPLARGLPSSRFLSVGWFRIIPARAGFTFASAAARCTSQDHPRSRGVYPWCLRVRFSRMGSSPLARGLP